MICCTLFKIVLLLQVVRVGAGKYCPYDYSYFTYSYQTKYCEYGCCDTKYSGYRDVCCSSSSSGSSSSSSSEVPVGIIVGSVFGSLVGLSVMIVTIRCICSALKNSSRQIGTVIQPANTNTPAFIVNTAALQGQAIPPIQQGVVGYVYPCAGSPPQIDDYEYMSPPPYGHHDKESQEAVCQEAKY